MFIMVLYQGEGSTSGPPLHIVIGQGWASAPAAPPTSGTLAFGDRDFIGMLHMIHQGHCW